MSRGRFEVWPLAASAALLLVIAGFEPWRSALEAIAQQWNVLLFIAGLMGLSAASQESGAFAWLTAAVLAAAGGNRRRLFLLLYGLGAMVTAVLSNDATAIVLTPIVYRAIATHDGDAAPFLFGCVFVANLASFGLPFSNPANVLILPHPHVSSYVWHLGPPQLAALAIGLAVFLFFFRAQLRGCYPVAPCGAPSARARRTIVTMAAVMPAYGAGLLLHWPLGPIAAAGAAACLAAAAPISTGVLRHISWRTLALLPGLFVLFDALMRAGFVAWALRGIGETTRYGNLAADAIAATSAAILSNAFNNLPVAVAASYVVPRLPSLPVAYPLIAGIDVGPNLFVTGSLATILWLSILRGYGVRIDLLQYLRLGALVVPPTLAVCVLWLWLVR